MVNIPIHNQYLLYSKTLLSIFGRNRDIVKIARPSTMNLLPGMMSRGSHHCKCVVQSFCTKKLVHSLKNCRYAHLGIVDIIHLI